MEDIRNNNRPKRPDGPGPVESVELHGLHRESILLRRS